MSDFVIDGNTVPSPMALTGHFVPEDPPIIATNGEGNPVVGLLRKATWTWERLSLSDYQFWTQTVLGGARYKVCTGTNTLPDDEQSFGNYSSIKVMKPTFAFIENGLYHNVSLEILEITA